ncbi:PIG-P-domain-containing protein [Bimuria novae-zelandiae CBS 107.79]|uniref:PIG-P-domain-containing protein n=1 Tax=Bimuria novae-zelandiae CBS 107.79 TaxID=1447943 RepID=A0A6A5V4I9_9PLEO|nr:PIG-P-domain-containing protein [Bimuria novae-zelandiae CBS 107.79]
MHPKNRGKLVPAGFLSKSTPSPTSPHTPVNEEPAISPPSSAHHASPSEPVSVEHGLKNEDEEEENFHALEESEGSGSDDEDDVSVTQSLHGQLPHAASSLFPPFYNRPPVPLPPSPSLTSLLRPSFSTATSRRTTPESSDVDVPSVVTGGSSAPASTTNLASITKSARHAPLVPRASPKVPTYEYYGFALYLASSAAFLLYIVWAYVPSPLLHQMGIHYYPNRWWALAVPCWLVALVIYIYIALASYNTQHLTLPMSSCENLVDETAQIALIDRRTGNIVRHGLSLGHGKEKSGTASANGSRRNTISAYQFSPAEEVDWKSYWSISTDAVMDVPIGGVCEILYGAEED